MYKYLIYLFVGASLLSCSAGRQKLQRTLRDHFVHQRYDEALSELEKNKDKDKRATLLSSLERGILFHKKGDFQKSIEQFESAKESLRKLYTKSVSKKVAQFTLNDNFENYYGAHYERSLIHFYQSLNHFLIYQQSGDRKSLIRAKAEVSLWDSVLDSYKDDRKGESVFKDDMAAKIFGGYIHESVGGNQNLNIALLLYKDAKKLLFQNYNAYRSLNNSFQKFKGDFSKLPKLPKDKVITDYVAATDLQNNLNSFLDTKILKLTRALRPYEFKKVATQIGANKDLVREIEKEKKSHLKDNVAIMLHKGLIPEKKAKEYNLGLQSAMKEIKNPVARAVIAGVGIPILTFFAADKLHLTPRNSWNLPGTVLGVHMANIAVQTAAISFELPVVENTGLKSLNKVQIKNAKEEIVFESDLVLVNPLGDISEEAVAEDALARYFRTGFRVALKHVAAIAVAYQTYKALGGTKKGGFLASNAALLEYLAATRIIAASEKADVRYWSLLPESLSSIHLYLPKGSYQVFLSNQGGSSWLKISDLEVKDVTQNHFVNYWMPN